MYRDKEVGQLLNALTNASCDQRCKAAAAIYGIMRVDPATGVPPAIAHACGIGGIIPPLVRLMNDGTLHGRVYAAGVLMLILVDEDRKPLITFTCRRACAKAGAIPPLIRMLNDSVNHPGKTFAASALRMLAYDETLRDAIASEGRGILPLIRLLTDGTADDKMHAAGALAVIILSDDNNHRRKQSCANAGIIVPLVKMLSDEKSDEAGKSYAAFALMQLAAVDAILRHRIAIEADGVPPLVRLAREGTCRQKTQAAGALMMLAQHETLRQSIAEGGGIPPLVQMLVDVDGDGRLQAMGALNMLIVDEANGRKQICAQAGGIGHLLQLLTDGTDGEKSQATVSLLAFGEDAGLRKILAAKAHPSSITTLVQLLGSSGPECHVRKACAAGALMRLLNEQVHVRTCMEGGGIALLVQLLLDSGATKRGQSFAAGALECMLERGDAIVHSRVTSAGAVAPLVELLIGGQSDNGQKYALRALLKLITGGDENAEERERTCQKMTAAGCIPVLLQMMGDADLRAKLRVNAGAALMSLLIQSDARQTTFVEEGGIQLLVQVLRDPYMILAGKMNAAGALTILSCGIRSLRSLIIDAGAIPPLVQVLKDSYPMPDAATTALAALIALLTGGDAEAKQACAKAGGVPELVRLLREGVNELQKAYTASVLSLLADATGLVECIVEAGAIPLLIALLREASSGCARMRVFDALTGLLDTGDTYTDGKTWQACAEAGALSLMTEFLSSTAPQDEKTHAVFVIMMMAHAETLQRLVAAESGTVAALVQLLKEGTCDGKASSAATLKLLVADSVSRKKTCEEAGAIPPLVKLLDDSVDTTCRAKVEAAGALKYLISESRERKQASVEAGAIPLLVQLLKYGTTEEGRTYAAGALLILAEDAENRHAIEDAGGIPLLTESLNVLEGALDSEGTFETVDGALYGLAFDGALKVPIAMFRAEYMFIRRNDLLQSPRADGKKHMKSSCN
ncbi:hypothetical protein CYMTET_24479 [Cymbomonas tetramitiformis]|uniref:U-box domain-containing protein n=1 Tax=Cymbomonas tetramitiformis TaxID=36881 RepID=A0AAE0FVS5_9CHLO|nr:hypothetical protein CYMTET_24479 [Cymbomonas tetramitiformis]|eukprot:gene2053-2749_t